MAISAEKINTILEVIATEYKIDKSKIFASLEAKSLLPNKMVKANNTSDKGPFDNKRAREFAEVNNIEIRGIVGSGRDGRITIADMKKHADSTSSTTSTDKIKITSAARTLAEENGIDLSTIVPSGKRGDILLKDVKDAIANKPAEPLVLNEPEEEEEEEKEDEPDVESDEEDPVLED